MGSVDDDSDDDGDCSSSGDISSCKMNAAPGNGEERTQNTVRNPNRLVGLVAPLAVGGSGCGPFIRSESVLNADRGGSNTEEKRKEKTENVERDNTEATHPSSSGCHGGAPGSPTANSIPDVVQPFSDSGS